MSKERICGLNKFKLSSPDKVMQYFGIDYREIRELADNLGCSTVDALNFALNDAAYDLHNVLRGNESKLVHHKACGTGEMINRQNQDYINYILHQLRVLGRQLNVNIKHGELIYEDPRVLLAVCIVSRFYERKLNDLYRTLLDSKTTLKRYNGLLDQVLADMLHTLSVKANQLWRIGKQAITKMEETVIGLWGEFDIERLNGADMWDVIEIYKDAPLFINLGIFNIMQSALNLDTRACEMIKQYRGR